MLQKFTVLATSLNRISIIEAAKDMSKIKVQSEHTNIPSKFSGKANKAQSYTSIRATKYL